VISRFRFIFQVCLLILSRRVGLRIKAFCQSGIHKQSSAGYPAECFHCRNNSAATAEIRVVNKLERRPKLKSTLDFRRALRENGAADGNAGRKSKVSGLARSTYRTENFDAQKIVPFIDLSSVLKTLLSHLQLFIILSHSNNQGQ